jgi:hypothetical protein
LLVSFIMKKRQGI